MSLNIYRYWGLIPVTLTGFIFRYKISDFYWCIKDFREKINNSPKTKSSENIKKKFESCPANIQMSPHLMSYIRLFNHCSTILTFYSLEWFATPVNENAYMASFWLPKRVLCG